MVTCSTKNAVSDFCKKKMHARTRIDGKGRKLITALVSATGAKRKQKKWENKSKEG